MTDWGIAFEKFSSELYKEFKKAVVHHDILKYFESEDGRVRAQFDFKYKNRLIPYIGLGEKIPTVGRWQYAECKFRTSSRVTFDEMTTFSGKLRLMGIPQRRGEFIANTSYEKRALVFAEEMGIKIVDRKDLVLMDYLRTTAKQGHPPLMQYSVFDKKLEERIRTYA